MVLSQDESESHSVRVVAINSDFKVIIDELFTPSHSHEAVVQHLESASHTLSLADIQVPFCYIFIYIVSIVILLNQFPLAGETS